MAGGGEALSAEDLFDAGLSAKMRGDVDRAMDCFGQVLKQYPLHVQAYLQLGKCEMQRGDVAAALETFRAGVKVSQRSAPLLAELGFLLLATGDASRAEKVLLGARRLSKRNTRTLVGLAWLYVQRQQWGKAIGALDDVLAASGSSFAGHYLLAHVHEALGKIADAQKEWFLTEGICREMIEVDAGQGAPQYYLGEIMRVTRTWVAAREHYEAAAACAPADAGGYLFGMGLAVSWATVLEAAATACAEDGDADGAARWRVRIPADAEPGEASA